jgi:hypothetical protein
MTARTRYFVIASLLVLVVGLGTGLVAYYVGLPAGAFSRAGGPEELQLIPRAATLVAYADVHDIMISNVRQKARELLPFKEDGQKDFQTKTGINIETDIDHIVVGVVPQQAQDAPFRAVVLARGRFEEAKIEALMREHGAAIEEYRGTRLLTAEPDRRPAPSLSVAFISPALVAVGSTPLVKQAVDLKNGGDSVLANEELINRIRPLDGTAWAVGRFDALAAQGRLPAGFAGQLPPITWFSASSYIDNGIRGSVRVDAPDEEAANNLREVLRGFVAFAKLQSGQQPAVKSAVDTLNVQGTGTSVELSFDLSDEAIDALASTVHHK